MDDERRLRLAEVCALAKARETTMFRLTAASCAIWLLGTFLAHLIEPNHLSERLTTIVGGALLIPAALVWLLYPRLVAAWAHRWLPEEYAALKPSEPDAPGPVADGAA